MPHIILLFITLQRLIGIVIIYLVIVTCLSLEHVGLGFADRGDRPTVVPAAIDELLHHGVDSPHHQLREGGDLDLVCMASGRPLPTVTWKYQVKVYFYTTFIVRKYHPIITMFETNPIVIIHVNSKTKGKSTQRRRVDRRCQSENIQRPSNPRCPQSRRRGLHL